ncbi:MAG TPA: hypothetical protein VN281_07990 [Verrucomicrobiae bacterium]|nr:hypothetical protein [Verrucomicrobiae bacterium]
MKGQRGPLVFALIFSWKVALFVFTAQPIPSNDSFFYDGAVLNFLLNGHYCNPSLAAALPISGTQVFSAYPPLYQVPLLAWASVFGVTALSVMALHLVLFGLYMLVLLAILRRLEMPDWCVQFAGAFLLLNTFHDRPDTLAHLLGMTAVYAWVRSRRIFADETPSSASGWTWLMSVLVVATLLTSLQIGGTYLVFIWIGTAASCIVGRERFPVAPMLATLAVPVALVFLISRTMPLAWAGFLEHVHHTPSVTGLRFPALAELLKAGRIDSGVLLAAVGLPWAWFKQWRDYDSRNGLRHEIVVITALLAALAIMVPSLFLLTPNTVAIPCYFQPLIVAAYLSASGSLFANTTWFRAQTILLGLAIIVGSLRAAGMSTWGVACAHDVGYFAAVQRVGKELENQPAGSTVVLSSAYLYEAASHKNVRWLHCDWLMQFGQGRADSDLQGLRNLHPTELILTQFDYYRRFEGVLAELKSDPGIRLVRIENIARVPAPESFERLRRVIQHVSWAPVIVDLDWK